LFLILEGRGSRTYSLNFKSPNKLGEADGVKITDDHTLQITFSGDETSFVKREILLPFLVKSKVMK
jgi:ABC-type oligopeptide transport system substrate-binding subunit